MEPYFVTDRDTLKKSLRLSGLNENGDAAVILDDAIKSALAEFHRQLGISQAAVIKAYTPADSPSTTQEVMRSIAETTETNLVKMFLIPSMAVLFQDAGAAGMEIWNEEGAFRGTDQEDRVWLHDFLWSSALRNMDLLKGETSLTDEPSITAITVDPETESPVPGASVLGEQSA